MADIQKKYEFIETFLEIMEETKDYEEAERRLRSEFLGNVGAKVGHVLLEKAVELWKKNVAEPREELKKLTLQNEQMLKNQREFIEMFRKYKEENR